MYEHDSYGGTLAMHDTHTATQFVCAGGYTTLEL